MQEIVGYTPVDGGDESSTSTVNSPPCQINLGLKNLAKKANQNITWMVTNFQISSAKTYYVKSNRMEYEDTLAIVHISFVHKEVKSLSAYLWKQLLSLKHLSGCFFHDKLWTTPVECHRLSLSYKH